MNLFSGQQWRYRHREQTYGHGGRGDGEGEMYREGNIEICVCLSRPVMSDSLQPHGL